MRIFVVSRGFLSFRDLCASRPVCKSWSDLKALPAHPFCVYFFEDGSEFNFPDSDNENFRKCLLAANLNVLHCQIFNQDQLQFVLQLLHSVKSLTIEIDADDDEDENAFIWDPYILSSATNAQKIHLEVNNVEDEIRIDFSALRKLTHFSSNARVLFENYDNRDMEFLGVVTDFWDAKCTEIIKNTKHLSSQRLDAPSSHFLDYVASWVVKNRAGLPLRADITMNSMKFITVTKDGFTIEPSLGNPGAQHSDFIEYYRDLWDEAFNIWPDVPLIFHARCTAQEKALWLNIINPIRERFGMTPFSLDEF